MLHKIRSDPHAALSYIRAQYPKLNRERLLEVFALARAAHAMSATVAA